MRSREFQFESSRVFIHISSKEDITLWKFSVSLLRNNKSAKFGVGMTPKEAIAACRKHISLEVTEKLKGGKERNLL